MPVYDYKCQEHGVFYALQTMAQYDQPQSCPQCAQLSARIILVAPQVLAMDPGQKKAIAKNESARHQPIISTADRRAHDQQHHQRCGCSNPRAGSKLFYTAKGEKMFPSMRPWMISH